MTVCNECGRTIATCCDIYDIYIDEDTGKEVYLCLDCQVKLGLVKEEEDDDGDNGEDNKETEADSNEREEGQGRG